MKKIYILFVLLVALIFGGCAAFLSTDFDEKRCIVTIDVHVAGEKSSNPDLFNDNIVAESMPVNGKIWVKGYVNDSGARPYNYGELGHELQHILSEQCEGFADPDTKETLMGTVFGKDK